MKNLQLAVDIAESSGNIADIESDIDFKFPESNSLSLEEAGKIKEEYLSHWSDVYTPIKMRFSV